MIKSFIRLWELVVGTLKFGNVNCGPSSYYNLHPVCSLHLTKKLNVEETVQLGLVNYDIIPSLVGYQMTSTVQICVT